MKSIKILKSYVFFFLSIKYMVEMQKKEIKIYSIKYKCDTSAHNNRIDRIVSFLY